MTYQGSRGDSVVFDKFIMGGTKKEVILTGYQGFVKDILWLIKVYSFEIQWLILPAIVLFEGSKRGERFVCILKKKTSLLHILWIVLECGSRSSIRFSYPAFCFYLFIKNLCSSSAVMENYKNAPRHLYGLTASQMDMFMTEDNPASRQAEKVTEVVQCRQLQAVLF